MKTVAIIPARLHSTRFPKKILYLIDEKPMVVHVYENAKKSEIIDDVFVAVDDDETIKELKKWKIKTILPEEDRSTDQKLFPTTSSRVIQLTFIIKADNLI